MEAKRVKVAALSAVVTFTILIIVARISLGLSKIFFLIAGLGTGGIFSILTWAFVQDRNDQRRNLLDRQLASEGQELRIEYSFLRKVAGVPTKFRHKELEEATDNFQSLVGRGASASVFKGILNDGTPVAVKRIEEAEHGDKEFRSEVAAIASVQHVNLVHLLGYCCMPRGPRFIVYEYIHNGSLDKWIFTEKGNQNGRGGCLPWNMRYRICIDIAKALAYLHHDCRSRILHLDIKPENILLDENFRALVSDFGFSKLMGKDVSRVVTTVRGTRGYLAPEWFLENAISEKSDIYSFGMVLLEIIGGRRNVCWTKSSNNSENKCSYFPRIVTEKLKEGKIMEVVDERLVGSADADEREARVLVHMALWCIQENPRLRPTMTHVVEVLEGLIIVDMPPETEILLVDFLPFDEEPTQMPEATHQMKGRVPASLNYSFSMSVLSGR